MCIFIVKCFGDHLDLHLLTHSDPTLRSADLEWCCGTVNGKYLVGTGNDDDTFDTGSGGRGGIQFGLVVQRAGGGDRMNEMNSQDLPYRSMPNLEIGRAHV